MTVNPDEEFYNALLDCAQMGACDRWTVQAGYATGPELMENAGAAVARHVMKTFPGAAVFHVLCGPGNNGGDGYVAARILAESGIEVRLYALAPPGYSHDGSRDTSETIKAKHLARNPGDRGTPGFEQPADPT